MRNTLNANVWQVEFKTDWTPDESVRQQRRVFFNDMVTAIKQIKSGHVGFEPAPHKCWVVEGPGAGQEVVANFVALGFRFHQPDLHCFFRGMVDMSMVTPTQVTPTQAVEPCTLPSQNVVSRPVYEHNEGEKEVLARTCSPSISTSAASSSAPPQNSRPSLWLRPGIAVRIHSDANHPSLNGQIGVVQSRIGNSNGWYVICDGRSHALSADKLEWAGTCPIQASVSTGTLSQPTNSLPSQILSQPTDGLFSQGSSMLRNLLQTSKPHFLDTQNSVGNACHTLASSVCHSPDRPYRPDFSQLSPHRHNPVSMPSPLRGSERDLQPETSERPPTIGQDLGPIDLLSNDGSQPERPQLEDNVHVQDFGEQQATPFHEDGQEEGTEQFQAAEVSVQQVASTNDTDHSGRMQQSEAPREVSPNDEPEPAHPRRRLRRVPTSQPEGTPANEGGDKEKKRLDSTPKPSNKQDERGSAMQECAICMEAPVDTVFVPCGHMATCNSCAERLGKRKPCPVCRKKIKLVQRVFIS